MSSILNTANSLYTAGSLPQSLYNNNVDELATSDAPSSFSQNVQEQLSATQEKISQINNTIKASRPATPDPRKEFSEYMDKSSAELIREMILKELNLTEEEIAAMTPEERQQVEEKIADMIEDYIQRKAEEKLEEIQKQSVAAAQATVDMMPVTQSLNANAPEPKED